MIARRRFFRSTPLRAVAAGFAAVCASALSGCANPLLPEKEDTSQFAAYDRARGITVAPFVEDEFGRRRPNLRGRLLPRE